jgi:hypothetical protein
MPIPSRLDVTEPPGVAVTDRLALREPSALGVNVTPTVHVADGAMVAHVLLVIAKSPCAAPVTVAAIEPVVLPPVLLTVNIIADDELPWTTEP